MLMDDTVATAGPSGQPRRWRRLPQISGGLRDPSRKTEDGPFGAGGSALAVTDRERGVADASAEPELGHTDGTFGGYRPCSKPPLGSSPLVVRDAAIS